MGTDQPCSAARHLGLQGREPIYLAVGALAAAIHQRKTRKPPEALIIATYANGTQSVLQGKPASCMRPGPRWSAQGGGPLARRVTGSLRALQFRAAQQCIAMAAAAPRLAGPVRGGAAAHAAARQAGERGPQRQAAAGCSPLHSPGPAAGEVQRQGGVRGASRNAACCMLNAAVPRVPSRGSTQRPGPLRCCCPPGAGRPGERER